MIPFESFLRDQVLNRSIEDDFAAIKLTISRWLAEVYQVICKETFNGYFSGHLSDTDFRVYFTHNVSLNFQHLIDFLWVRHA